MKYLIFFLSFFIATNVSAQLEFDSLPPYIVPIAPLHVQKAVYSDSKIDIDVLLPHDVPYVSDTRSYIIQEYTKNADWVIIRDPVVVIEGETKVTGICQIVEDGRIRYGLTVEISDSEGTMLTIFPLPESDNSLWEQLAKQK